MAALSVFGSLAAARPQIDLSGQWDFYPDVADAKLTDVQRRPARILVPGAWQAQGYGTPGGTIPSANIGPGTSPAEYLRHNLMARCLYVREADIPQNWRGRRVFLCVRRAYRYTDLTVNGREMGRYEGFCSPFEFDVTDAIRFAGVNQFVLGVDNRPRPGRDTLGTANLFGNWGGLGGRVYLEARPQTWIDDVFAIPRIATTQAVLRISVRGSNAAPALLELGVTISPVQSASNAGKADQGRIAMPLSVGQPVDLPITISGARLWTPDDPFLYLARVQLLRGDQVLDEVETRFGLREITAEGNKLFLNGKPLYLSGYGDDATEPITGMLPGDIAVYRKRLSLMRSLGFNFVRHHSCVPHDEYLDAADEIGMLVQPEAGLAYTGFWRTGYELFAKEWPNIIRGLRNHPSVWAWCMGNELFLNELPEAREKGPALALSPPLTNGALRSVPGERNGVFGPAGIFPTNSFKQSNYYRDLEVTAQNGSWNLLGEAKSTKVFDDGPHELGLRFIAAQDCLVSKIRYYRVAEERGEHVGRIWDEAGHELARVTFANETATGWQETSLPTTVSVRSNRVYTVSVNANTAYCATSPGAAEGPGRQQIMELVTAAYRQAKELDPTRLVHASDGGTVHPFTDVISGGGESAGTKPRLLHEYGTYCSSLPDFSLIPRLNGVIRPLTYERAERYVREHALGDVYSRLYHSSLFMRADAQKYYMEAAKAGHNSGFSFWLGVDFPDSPEGCWDEGILNQLWEPKPHLTDNLRDYLGPTVLLTQADLKSRSFYSDEPKRVGLLLWHYGAEPISGARLSWRVLDAGEVVANGEIPGIRSDVGQRNPIGEIALEPMAGSAPRFLTLEAELQRGKQRVTRNAWEFYSYPRPGAPTPQGVYSEAGPVPGAVELKPGEAPPPGARLLITKTLTRAQHGALLNRGNCSVLLLGTAGFKETRAGYFLNQYGAGFGGIIEEHPMFAGIPHQGRLHLGLYQLIAGGGVFDLESMPTALSEGAVVWGLQLTGWISPVKNLRKVGHVCEVITDHNFHLVLCNLDLLADRPESRYVLSKTMDYLLSGKLSDRTHRCTTEELQTFLR